MPSPKQPDSRCYSKGRISQRPIFKRHYSLSLGKRVGETACRRVGERVKRIGETAYRRVGEVKGQRREVRGERPGEADRRIGVAAIGRDVSGKRRVGEVG